GLLPDERVVHRGERGPALVVHEVTHPDRAPEGDAGEESDDDPQEGLLRRQAEHRQGRHRRAAEAGVDHRHDRDCEGDDHGVADGPREHLPAQERDDERGRPDPRHRQRERHQPRIEQARELVGHDATPGRTPRSRMARGDEGGWSIPPRDRSPLNQSPIDHAVFDQFARTRAGNWSNRWIDHRRSSAPTQLAVRRSVITTASSFSPKERVCSWIWVSAWNRLTSSPTNVATTSVGNDSNSTRTIAFTA